jgi:hypothetical protein
MGCGRHGPQGGLSSGRYVVRRNGYFPFTRAGWNYLHLPKLEQYWNEVERVTAPNLLLEMRLEIVDLRQRRVF